MASLLLRAPHYCQLYLNPLIDPYTSIDIYILRLIIARRPFCFLVDHPKGSLYLAGSSGPDRFAWVNAMRQAIRVHLRVRRHLISISSCQFRGHFVPFLPSPTSFSLIRTALRSTKRRVGKECVTTC